MTNIDSIRNANVEELAELLSRIAEAGAPEESEAFCDLFGSDDLSQCDGCTCNDEDMKACIARWMTREEAKAGSHADAVREREQEEREKEHKEWNEMVRMLREEKSTAQPCDLRSCPYIDEEWRREAIEDGHLMCTGEMRSRCAMIKRERRP